MEKHKMNDRIITVKGIGKVTAKPDVIIIVMTLTAKTLDYTGTIEKAALDIDGMRKALLSIGYDEKDLKTTDFNIQTAYESYKDAKGNYMRCFDGYICTHALRLEFALDMKRLGETLKAISESKTVPEFNINFSVKDKNAIAELLLENAIANAKAKADVLAKAASVKLGAIKHIDYNWGEVHFMSNTRTRGAFISEVALSASPTMDIEPEDIETSDTVTVVWNIE